MNLTLTMFNQLTPSAFLRDYWQKKPLLIRNALPDFQGLLSPNELAGLACEEEVQSRIIAHQHSQWTVQHGPFNTADFSELPPTDWTLLVQNVNHFLPEAAQLLSLFNFIPHARLDDLMVSYAPSGGGVGPHVDSYDVFLLQGSGQRLWKISTQTELTFAEDAPIKVLTNFVATDEWLLSPGDMLYLPPQVAHWGIAADDACMTYSVGFRAPQAQELTEEFLHFLHPHVAIDGIYADADLALQQHPAEISDAMIDQVATVLHHIRWDRNLVARFLGSYLSEPKAHVQFDPPRPMTLRTFKKNIGKKPLQLDLKSICLFHQAGFYLNGEALTVPPCLTDAMQQLADNRYLDARQLDDTAQQALAICLHSAYLAGFIRFG